MDVAETAKSLLSQGEPDKAIEFIDQSYTNHHDDLEYLQLKAEVLLEIGDHVPQALDLLTRAAQLDPQGTKGGGDKFLWLGQLSGGHDAIRWFQTGIDIVQDKGKITSALCSMVEVWMTDLCMEPPAESQSEHLASQAVIIDSSYTDAWTTLGSVRISQLRLDDARQALKRGFETMANQDSIDSLLNLSRLLLETGMNFWVPPVVSRIHLLDDSIPESYYLQALAYIGHLQSPLETYTLDPQVKDFLLPPDDKKIHLKDLSRHALTHALSLIHQQPPDDDNTDMSSEITRLLELLGPQDDDNNQQDDDDNDDDGAWEDEIIDNDD